MRDIGIITLLSVIATAAAPSPKPHDSGSFLTAKSTQEFADCFAKTQDRSSAPWWFVPKAHGGTFSNLGGASVTDPYFVTISDRGTVRAIKLDEAAPRSAQAVGVEQCI